MIATLGALAGLVVLVSGSAAPRDPGALLRRWGEETLQGIETDLLIPGRDLYAEEVRPGERAPDRPASNWACGVQLSALAAAARAERHWREPLRRFADALQAYWIADAGVEGYNVLPAPSPPDRYYDDNAWMVLALAETWEVTRDRRYLDRAEAAMRFVLSGEDDRLGGGIYWRERERTSKNTCSNAPSAAAALRLYQLTRKPAYLETARRLVAWVNAHLQDPTDGIYWDSVGVDGAIGKDKWSYNTALMLRTNCLFYTVTRERSYLEEARRIARAAEARWVRPDSGIIADDAAFAHLLSEAFLALYEVGHDRHWRDVVFRALTALHDQGRDASGHYPKRWDARPATPLTTVRLIDQASAARAYWRAAAP